VRWLGGRENDDGPQLEVKFRGYASCTRPGFRPAGNFRLSPDRVVKQESTHVFTPLCLETGRPPGSNRSFPLLCPAAGRQLSHSGSCAAYRHIDTP
jgi:hypothetical protein